MRLSVIHDGSTRSAGEWRRVQITDFIDAFSEAPAVRGALVTIVVDRVIEVRGATTHADDLAETGSAGRGVSREGGEPGVGRLDEDLEAGLALLPELPNAVGAGGLDSGVRDANHAVRREQ